MHVTVKLCYAFIISYPITGLAIKVPTNGGYIGSSQRAARKEIEAPLSEENQSFHVIYDCIVR